MCIQKAFIPVVYRSPSFSDMKNILCNHNIFVEIVDTNSETLILWVIFRSRFCIFLSIPFLINDSDFGNDKNVTLMIDECVSFILS